jgi:hypothetical protein
MDDGLSRQDRTRQGPFAHPIIGHQHPSAVVFDDHPLALVAQHRHRTPQRAISPSSNIGPLPPLLMAFAHPHAPSPVTISARHSLVPNRWDLFSHQTPDEEILALVKRERDSLQKQKELKL